MTELPQKFVDLVKANPLEDQKEMALVLSGDLEFAMAAYRKKATYHGSRGNWWRVFREVCVLRGISTVEACSRMSSKQLSRFSAWAFEAGYLDDGIDAQRALAKLPERHPAVHLGNVRFLMALLQVGRNEEVLEVVKEAVGEEEPEDFPDQQRYAARALLAMGRAEEAVQTLQRALTRHHDDAYLWAQLAIAYQQLGRSAERAAAVEEASRLGLYNPYNQPDLRNSLLRELQIPQEAWVRMHAPYAVENLSYDQLEVLRQKNPACGFHFSETETPHLHGGDTFEMPACRGCGHGIRQAFVLDIRAHAPLAKVLPDWTLMPLLLCPDCSVQLGRHDYEVDVDARRVRLVNVAINVRQFGKSNRTMPPIKARHVELGAPSDGTEIGGQPFWIQDPLRIFCRTCRNEMIYVASLCDQKGFEPSLQISGYLYHFACNDCKTISVVAQFS